MRILLVLERGVFLCGNGEGTRLLGMSSGDAIAQAGLTKARAVLLAGLVSVEPLALAFRLRSAYPKKRLPIVVLGSLGEISKTENPSDVRLGDLVYRLRPAYEKPNPSNSSTRMLFVDMPGREISSGSARSACSPAEFRLLTLFLRYPDTVFSRMELLRRITADWQSVNTRMIDVLIRRLRRKIESDPAAPAHLLTIQGLGYVFRHNSDIFYDRLTGHRFYSWPEPDAGPVTILSQSIDN